MTHRVKAQHFGKSNISPSMKQQFIINFMVLLITSVVNSDSVYVMSIKRVL